MDNFRFDDFRFEITEHHEPELGCTHTVRVYAIGGTEDGELLETLTPDRAHAGSGAARRLKAAQDDVLRRVHEHYEPCPDNSLEDLLAERDSSGWALVQYNGGRAPGEKWLTTFPALAQACYYAAQDDEWEPEEIINLTTGQGFGPVRTVAQGAPLRNYNA